MELILRVNSCRYLGVIIDCELKWKEHIEYIYKELIKYNSIFYKLRNKQEAQLLLGKPTVRCYF